MINNISEVQKLYDEWVATSNVPNDDEYRSELAKTIRTYREIRNEYPHLSHAEVEALLREKGLTAVIRVNNQACCRFSHFKEDLINGAYKHVALPDHLVCPRERAWRRYVRVRDGKDVNDMSVN